MQFIKAFTLIIAVFVAESIYGQEFRETLSETMAFDSKNAENKLVVYNINGPVHVESYSGDQVEISVEKRIRANSQKQVDKGKEEIGVNVEKHENIIYVYLRSPHVEFNKETGKFKHEGNWDEDAYRSRLEYTIKVPQGTNLKLSTINNGEISVENVQAQKIKASNINGPITMENIAGQVHVNALNRDINLSFASNPTDDSEFHSLNGDINITVQRGLNADVSFESLNGEIYTNLETTMLPSKLEKSNRSGKRGTKYKIDHNARFRIGDGGVNWDFKLLNGDVTIKE